MADVEELATILREVRALMLARPGGDLSWSARHDAAQALGEIDGALARIARGELPRGLQLRALFSLGGPIREVALSSGWARELAAITTRFDDTITRVYGG